jgi:hypothetical protein
LAAGIKTSRFFYALCDNDSQSQHVIIWQALPVFLPVYNQAFQTLAGILALCNADTCGA